MVHQYLLSSCCQQSNVNLRGDSQLMHMHPAGTSINMTAMALVDLQVHLSASTLCACQFHYPLEPRGTLTHIGHVQLRAQLQRNRGSGAGVLCVRVSGGLLGRDDLRVHGPEGAVQRLLDRLGRQPVLPAPITECSFGACSASCGTAAHQYISPFFM